MWQINVPKLPVCDRCGFVMTKVRYRALGPQLYTIRPVVFKCPSCKNKADGVVPWYTIRSVVPCNAMSWEDSDDHAECETCKGSGFVAASKRR